MKQLFTKPRLILLGKVTVFVLSFMGCAAGASGGIDVFGGQFGMIVLIWHARSMRNLFSWRNLAYVISSTLIWIALWELFVLNTPSFFIDNELAFFVLIYTLPLMGAVLLTVAHALLLGAALRRILLAIPIIYGTCLPAFHAWGGRPHDDGPFLLYLSMFIWQAAYLISMFGYRKKEPEVEAEATGSSS